MSDARRYAVWPEPRSRSRSLKGSRPSVPHGTNFCFIVLVIIYYKIVHVVQNNEKYRRHSKIKGNIQIHSLYQLSAKKLIISHNSSLDKIHPLSLSYQSLHAIKSHINWYIRAWSSVSVLRQYCLTTALISTVPARNSLTVKLYRSQ